MRKFLFAPSGKLKQETQGSMKTIVEFHGVDKYVLLNTIFYWISPETLKIHNCVHANPRKALFSIALAILGGVVMFSLLSIQMRLRTSKKNKQILYGFTGKLNF